MAISFANLGVNANPDINNDGDAASYSNSSWTPPTTGLILVAVASRNQSGPNTPTISGNGLTWVQIATVAVATVSRISVFAALAAGATTGATTIAFGGQTQRWCNVSFAHVTGVDLSGGVAGAIVQSPTNQNSSANPSLSITLAAAGSADNRPYSAWLHGSNEAATPRTNWTELDDLAGTSDNRGIETQYRPDAFETTASCSCAVGGVWAGIALELKAAAAGDTLTAAGITSGTPALDAPSIGQVHALSVAVIAAGTPAVGAPSLGQVHALTIAAITAGTPTLGAPAIGQAHALTVAAVTAGTPTLGAPAIGQVHALTAAGIAADTPTLGAPALGQVHGLVVAGITSGTPVVGAPAVGQVHMLIQQDITSGIPNLDATMLGSDSTHSLTAAGIAAGTPTVGQPFIAQVHALEATALVTGQPAIGLPTLAQKHALVASGVVSGVPAVGVPSPFGQRHNLSSAGVLSGTPVLGAPLMVGWHTLLAAGITAGIPVLGAPRLHHYGQANPSRAWRVPAGERELNVGGEGRTVRIAPREE